MNLGLANIPLPLGKKDPSSEHSIAELVATGSFAVELGPKPPPPPPPPEALGYSQEFMAKFDSGPVRGILGESCGENAIRRAHLSRKIPDEYRAFITRLATVGASFTVVADQATEFRQEVMEKTVNIYRPVMIGELGLSTISELALLDTALFALAGVYFYRAIEARFAGGSKADIQAAEKLGEMAARCTEEFRETLSFLRMLKGQPTGNTKGQLQQLAVQVNVGNTEGGGHGAGI
jgi:hypothetical protein